MQVSDKIDILVHMMEVFSLSYDSFTYVTRRMYAIGLLAYMRDVIKDLEELNGKMDTEICIEAANIDFQKWHDKTTWDNVQHIFEEKAYQEVEDESAIINHMTDLMDKETQSYCLKGDRADKFRTGMRQLCSDEVLHISTIREGLTTGVGKISILLDSIKDKKNNIPDDLYENYWDNFICDGLDYTFQRVEEDYNEWKEEANLDDIQELKDKRTREIYSLLKSGIFSHRKNEISKRQINESAIKIAEEAFEGDIELDENIKKDCAYFSSFVTMENDILDFNDKKIGKYLYVHDLDILKEQADKLRYFYVIIDKIHHDMAECNPSLKIYLKDYEDNQKEEIILGIIDVINTCTPYLSDKVSQDFLTTFMRDSYYGEMKHYYQKKFASATPYSTLCYIVGALKAQYKIFKVETTSDNLAKALSAKIKKPQKDSLKRYIDTGASDKESEIYKWVDSYVKKHVNTKSENVFLRISAETGK